MWCFHGDRSLTLVSHPMKDVGRRKALPFTKAQAPPGANHSTGRRQKLWFPWQRRQRSLLSTAISWSRDVDCLHPIQRGFSSPFLIRKEPTQSFSAHPQPPATRLGPSQIGRMGTDGLLSGGLQTVLESCPVCGYLLSPGVCLGAGMGACVDVCQFVTPTLLGEAGPAAEPSTAWSRRTGTRPKPSSGINLQADPSKSHPLCQGSHCPPSIKCEI